MQIAIAAELAEPDPRQARPRAHFTLSKAGWNADESAPSTRLISEPVSQSTGYAHEVELLEVVPRVKLLKTPPQKFDFLTFDELSRLRNEPIVHTHDQ